MKTQSSATAERHTYLIPPLSLTFTVAQEHKNRCVIDVRAYSGSHCFVHRQLEVFYDVFEDIPAMVGSSMLSWTLWLVQFEAARRDQNSGRQVQLQFPMPSWPSPEWSAPKPPDVEF